MLSSRDIIRNIEKEIGQQFSQIDQRFELISWIDSQILDVKTSLDSFIKEFTERLQRHLECTKAGAFVIVDKILDLHVLFGALKAWNVTKSLIYLLNCSPLKGLVPSSI